MSLLPDPFEDFTPPSMPNKRRPLDFYETAPWQVDALVDHLPELSGTILCPCVGDGSLLKRLYERRDCVFITNDIDKTKAADYHFDATGPALWQGSVDWVVENPPFGCAIEIARRAYDVVRCGVVLMARISFVEGVKARGEWLKTHPRQKQIVLERYSFTGEGKSDSATTEWLVWAKIPIANPGGYTAYGYKPRR